MLRLPAVAGQFYPGNKAELQAMLGRMLAAQTAPQPALLAISPHAGYIFSGGTAGKVLSRVEITDRVLILGPNHRGLGRPAALASQGQWRTPLGAVDLDQDLAEGIMKHCPWVKDDPSAHRQEHSLEVQVPFLQQLKPGVKITPLTISMLGYEQCAQLGKALAAAIGEAGQPVLMVASTDMSHYESALSAAVKDERAIERILALDPQGLYETVTQESITMCGVLPTTVCLVAALALGATDAQLVEYTNSGAVTGDNQQVVGYAGLIVK